MTGEPRLAWLLSELGELTVMVHDFGRVDASPSSLPLIESRGEPPLTVARRCFASIWKRMGAPLSTSPPLPAWKTSLSLSISLSVSVSFKLQLNYDRLRLLTVSFLSILCQDILVNTCKIIKLMLYKNACSTRSSHGIKDNRE